MLISSPAERRRLSWQTCTAYWLSRPTCSVEPATYLSSRSPTLDRLVDQTQHRARQKQTDRQTDRQTYALCEWLNENTAALFSVTEPTHTQEVTRRLLPFLSVILLTGLLSIWTDFYKILVQMMSRNRRQCCVMRKSCPEVPNTSEEQAPTSLL